MVFISIILKKNTKSHFNEIINYNENSLKISSDGNFLASAYNSTIKIWRFKNGDHEIFKKFKGLSSEVICISFVPDNPLLIAGYKNGNIEIFNIDSGTIKNFTKNKNSINRIKSIWSRYKNGNFEIFNLTKNENSINRIKCIWAYYSSSIIKLKEYYNKKIS